MKRAVVVVGLGYGDEGKGTITDALTRQLGADAVVRFNGGPQAAHHVVSPAGRLHCFAQFGSGTLVPKVASCTTQDVLIEPFAMQREAQQLASIGVTDALSRQHIDARCVIITPFHKLLNRMQELARGDQRHGSCGLGVGQAWMDTQKPKYPVIRAQDALSASSLAERLKFLWMLKVDVAEQIVDEHPEIPQLRDLCAQLKRKTLVPQLVEAYQRFFADSGVRLLTPPWAEAHPCAIFEGAQGVLLDMERGFWPHVTPSHTTSHNARRWLREEAPQAKVTTIGVLRAYSTRHGAGPFVTEDPSLRTQLPDLHNGHNRWQGNFRVGWFDLLKARYALRVAGDIDAIALTNIDRLASMPTFKVCTAYTYHGPKRADLSRFFTCKPSASGTFLTDIRAPQDSDRATQTTLTSLLAHCRPVLRRFESWTPQELPHDGHIPHSPALTNFLDFLQSDEGLRCPIAILSSGPRANHKTLTPHGSHLFSTPPLRTAA